MRNADSAPREALLRENAELTRRLTEVELMLHQRSERLYELQQHYSSEHFSLQESLRNLKIERLRNAGAHGALETTVERAERLQARIAELKERLRRYEDVEDDDFDIQPILIRDQSES